MSIGRHTPFSFVFGKIGFGDNLVKTKMGGKMGCAFCYLSETLRLQFTSNGYLNLNKGVFFMNFKRIFVLAAMVAATSSTAEQLETVAQSAEQPAQQRQVVRPTGVYVDILTQAGLSEYVRLFHLHRMTDVNVIASLTSEELGEMGIEIIGDRRRIMEAFSAVAGYSRILTEAGLSEYIPLFLRHRITDINTIASLTSEELREMGVEAIGDRRRIMEAFSFVRAQKNMENQQESATNNGERNFAHQKGDHHLNFAFTSSWHYGIGTSIVWDIATGNMFSIGLGVDYSKRTEQWWNDILTERYLTPSARFAFHWFSIPGLAGRRGLSRHDWYYVVRAGVMINFWDCKYTYNLWWAGGHPTTVEEKFSGTDFTFFGNFASSGYRLHLSEKFHLWTEFGLSGWMGGLGFRF